jgi:hypothetical protein
MINDTLTFSLFPNINKTNELHPDLTGKFSLAGKSYEAASWTRTTLDGQRQYHSVLIYDALGRAAAFRSKTKCQPIAKVKLYESRKRLETDPDFHGPDPFSLENLVWYATLTVKFSQDPKDLELMGFTMSFSRQPTLQAASPEALTSLSALRDRLVERERERKAEQARLEQEKQEQAEFEKRQTEARAAAGGDEPDDLDMSPSHKEVERNETGDPVELPF